MQGHNSTIRRLWIDAEGNLASFDCAEYLYRPQLRAFIAGLFEASKRSSNRFFVIAGDVVIAAQSTHAGAMTYMTNPARVLVTVNRRHVSSIYNDRVWSLPGQLMVRVPIGFDRMTRDCHIKAGRSKTIVASRADAAKVIRAYRKQIAA